MEVATVVSGLTGIWAAWSTYGEDIKGAISKRWSEGSADKILEGLFKAWDRVDWALSARKYRRALEDMYGTIRILGKAELVSLEGIFTDVHILEKPTAFHRYDIKHLREEPEQLDRRKTRKGGLRLVKDPANKRIFILGKPGAGKTTFLKYLTIQAAKGKLDRTPIFIALKEWADSGLPLMNFLVKQFDICDFPDAKEFVEYILRKGDVLVLFDGLDEVNQEGNQRARMIDELRDFSNKYSKAQCLITCRVAATEYTFNRFVYVELADFTNKQVEIFVRKWFRGSRKKRKLFDEAFYRPDNQRLQELARTPLLLSLLCLSFDATLEFPQRRVEIYEEALEALLKKWDTSRSIKRDEIYRGLSLGRKRQMFARIAAKSFQEGRYFFTQAELSKQIVAYLHQLPHAEEEDIDGDTILKAIEAQHGVFTERAHKIYSFSHLTFQEYFTAKQIVSDTTGKALRDLLATDNLFDSRWREVILLTVSLLDDADVFFETFLTSLSEMANRDRVLLSILNWANEKTKGFSYTMPSLRAHYCYLLLSLFDPPSVEHHDYQSVIEDAAISLAGRLDPSHLLTKAILADTKDNIRRARRCLTTSNYDGLDAIPDSLLDIDSSIGLHISYAFLSVLGLTTIKDSVDTSTVAKALRLYVTELRKYAISLAEGAPFGTPHSELSSELRIALATGDLVVLPDSAPTYSWAELAEKLRKIVVRNQVNPHDIQPDWELVSRFFALAHLLLDCLKLAVVPDRRRIEERILLLS